MQNYIHRHNQRIQRAYITEKIYKVNKIRTYMFFSLGESDRYMFVSNLLIFSGNSCYE